jgi:hypothetical protein
VEWLAGIVGDLGRSGVSRRLCLGTSRFSRRGNVSDPDPLVTEDEREDSGRSPRGGARPRRERRPPTKLADYV